MAPEHSWLPLFPPTYSQGTSKVLSVLLLKLLDKDISVSPATNLLNCVFPERLKKIQY